MERWIWWSAATLTVVIYATMLSWTLPEISAAGGGLAPLDLRPAGYTPEQAREFLSALSVEGRALYTGPQRWLDLFYPPLLAVTLAGAIWKLYHARALRYLFVLVIVGGMAADWAENALVAGLLRGATDDAAIAAASHATLVKSALVSAAFLGVLFGLIRAGGRQLVKWWSGPTASGD